MVENQKDRPVINCDNQNVFRSKYLGSLFTTDGRQIHDIKVRVVMALARCGKLRHVLDSPDLSVLLKRRISSFCLLSIVLWMRDLDVVTGCHENDKRRQQQNAGPFYGKIHPTRIKKLFV